MAADFSIFVPIVALDRFAAPIGRMGGALEGFGKKAERIGRKLTVGLTLPLAAFGTKAVSTALEYQRALNNVQAITGGAADVVEDLGAKTSAALGERGIPTTLRDTAGAMAELAHSGLSLTEVERALPGVLELAAAAQEDQATAASATTDVLDAYALSVEDAARVTDVLAFASKKGQQELEGTTEGVIAAGAVARGFHQDLETTVAVLNELAQAGKKGGAGAAIFNRGLTSLARPGAQTRQTLRALHLEARDLFDRNGNLLQFDQLLEVLTKHGATARSAIGLFGAKAGPALGTLLGEGTRKVRTFADELRGAGGAAEQLAKVQLGGGVGELEDFSVQWEKLLVLVARSGLLEGLGKLIPMFAKGVAWISRLSPKTLELAVGVGAVATVVGPALVALGGLTTTVGGLAKAFAVLGASGTTGGLVRLFGSAVPWVALAASIGSITSDVLSLWDAIHGVGSEPAGGPKIDRPALDAAAFPAGAVNGRPVGADRVGRAADAAAGARGARVGGRIQVEFKNTPPGTRVRARAAGDVPVDVETGYNLAAGLAG